MNWLITGGCGFIGSALVQKLLEDPKNKIRIIDNVSVGSVSQLDQVCDYTLNPTTPGSEQVELFIADITDLEVLKCVSEGVDVIIHMAAMSGVRESVEYPSEWFYNNTVGTFNVLEAARLNKIDRVVCASSGASVGEVDPPVTEELPMHPISPYGATKSCMEVMCSAYFYSYGIETVCLRFSNVFGPLSTAKNSLVAKFIKAIMSAETFEVYGDGEQTRDFIYLDDLLEAVILSSTKKDVGGEVFQLCSGEERSVNEVILKMSGILPFPISVEHIAPKVGDLRTNWADNSKAKKMLGWEPKVEFDDGLRRTINFFLK